MIWSRDATLSRVPDPSMRAPGPAVVYLHGFLGSAEDFREDVERLGARRPAHALTLPGHGPGAAPIGFEGGATPGPRIDIAFDDVVDALAGELARLSEAPPCVIGYSMGGRLALALAARHPASVDRVVAISASAGIPDAEARARRAGRDRRLADRLRAWDFPAFVAAWYALPLFSGIRDDAGFDALVRRRLSGSPGRLADALDVLTPGRQPYVAPLLARRDVPVLLVAGDRDRHYVALHREIAAGRPGITARVVAGAHHAVHVANPRATRAHIDEFLTTPTAPPRSRALEDT